MSKGESWPDDHTAQAPPGSVILLSAEDDPATSIRPRLDAAGADASRVGILVARRVVDGDGRGTDLPVCLETDMGILEEAIARISDCRLVVIDPVSAYTGRVDTYKNAEVRQLLARMAEMAGRFGVAVVLVDHLNKNSNARAMYRGMGSVAFVAASRAAWAVAKDPEDQERRLVLPIKTNLAPDSSGLAYRIEATGPDSAPRIVWDPNPVTVTADEVLGGGRREGAVPTEVQRAVEWLRSELRDGPVLQKAIMERADGAGFSQATVRRAFTVLGVKSQKESFSGPWLWALSDQDGRQDAQGSQDAQPSEARCQ
ncbi:MAG: AAA family ATPase [Planctomycetota bacterium]